ncbi:MAG: iron-sulfur cluster-binding protein [Deltaproteobacteria bacterium]|nr:iron-sulfur cluster-binding protein [Deltaproteobacteria bacterium]
MAVPTGATFGERAARALADARLQRALQATVSRFMGLRDRAMADLPDLEQLRERAKAIKAATLARLDEHLAALADRVKAVGGEVHWAADRAEARAIVVELARSRGVRRIVKSKSMASEELDLNEALEGAGLEVVETDLGEWIIQLAHEKPSHIIAPAIHRDRYAVAELFSEVEGRPLPPEPELLTAVARQRLRQAFLAADMGISGVNFAVAETGTLVLVTNEGNGRLVTSLPRVHVAIMGMEKVIPRVHDLAVFLRLLARSATGQKMTSYVSLLTGPRRPGEPDGPEELHLIILDGGRSRALGGPFEEALSCIRCGACLNVCPVYQKAGGHSYGSTYPGPIGLILTPMLRGLEVGGELASASTLCGACRDACPVGIDLPRMILHLRREVQEHGLAPPGQRLALRLLGLVLQRPWLYRAVAALGRAVQPLFLRDGRMTALPGLLRRWTRERDFPRLARRPFQVEWAWLERSHERRGDPEPRDRR